MRPQTLSCGHREDDISDVMQEISALANCNCPQITKYYDSFMLPHSSKLLIAMELMGCSGSDLVRSFLLVSMMFAESGFCMFTAVLASLSHH
jgi:serine/threonine protein kinase